MVHKRILDLSCDENAFNSAKVTYKLALKHSGYKSEIKFDQQPSTRRKRNRKIIWFNPPFSQNVKINTGKLFIKFVRTNFPKIHRFRKIFNLNLSKLSYSSMANLQSLVKLHNAKVLTDVQKPTRLCNCRYKDSCPMAGKCLAKYIFCKAEVYSTTTRTMELYYGTSDGGVKTRFNNHTRFFRHERYSTETELSKYIWKPSNDKF